MSRNFGSALAGMGTLGALCIASGAAWGHVAFTAPAASERLEPGSTYPIVWTDTIPHNTERYELYFIPSSGAAREPIQIDIDPATHSYDWPVPMTTCGDCALYVAQINIDYTDYDHTVPIIIGDPPMTADTNAGASPGPASGSSTGASGCQLSAGSRSPTPGHLAAMLTALGLAAATLAGRRSHRQRRLPSMR